MEERVEFFYNLKTVLFIGLVALIVGFVVGAAYVSESDTKPDDYHVARWAAMEGDYAFKVLDPEERIEAIMVEIRNGADPKPAWPVVSAMLNEAYADLYAKGFVECQEECDEAIDQINMVHALMESERR